MILNKQAACVLLHRRQTARVDRLKMRSTIVALFVGSLPPASQHLLKERDTEARSFLLFELSCVDVTPNIYLSINFLILCQMQVNLKNNNNLIKKTTIPR